MCHLTTEGSTVGLLSSGNSSEWIASEQRVQSEAASRVTSRLWKQLARSNCDGEQSLDTPDGMFHTSVGCYVHETAERLKE